MDALVNIAVFGIAGAVMTAALMGLLMVSRISDRSKGARGLVVAVMLAVFVVLPVLAVAALPGSPGFGGAFLTAFGVIAVGYVVNLAMTPLLLRVSPGSVRRVAGTWTFAGLAAAALAVCAVLALLTAGAGMILG
ncbi:hypothetical protein [Marinactinospora rubrisoli]|uniref:Uncharacterized protein n=1 Tax=Marinactinospora rubrisoli TaxID=2715399 RepID=A0ABW2KL31_9ACTN